MKMNNVRELFHRQREAWIEDCRATARHLLIARPGIEITIEDVLAECPRPSYVHRNTTGHVFRSDDFKHCGWVQARKPSSNRRWIMKWTLSDDVLVTLKQIRRARQPEMVE